MKKSLENLNLFAASDLPISFDARRKWSSRHEDKCPTIKKVLNSGKGKCGWVYRIHINQITKFNFNIIIPSI